MHEAKIEYPIDVQSDSPRCTKQSSFLVLGGGGGISGGSLLRKDGRTGGAQGFLAAVVENTKYSSRRQPPPTETVNKMSRENFHGRFGWSTITTTTYPTTRSYKNGQKKALLNPR